MPLYRKTHTLSIPPLPLPESLISRTSPAYMQQYNCICVQHNNFLSFYNNKNLDIIQIPTGKP